MNLFLYVEESSWLHRTDPRSKIVALIAVFFLALGLQGVRSLLVLVGVLLAAGLSAGFGAGLRRIARLLGMILLTTTLLWGGSTGNIRFWGPFTVDGLTQGLTMGCKMSIMIIGGLIWLSTTKIEEMCIGMEKLGVPYPVAFAFSTAIRLVPWMVGSCLTVAEAQQSRGLDLTSGSILSRIRKYIPLLIPALVSVIRNANCFSMALESRGFGSRLHRTPYLQIGFGRNDAGMGLGLLVLSAVCLGLHTGEFWGLLRSGLILVSLFFVFIVVLRVAVTRNSGRVLWLNTRMVVLTAVSAALYAAVVIPFKGFVLVPGVSDFRPGMALPPVLGILFGPAAAWGSGFGCIISDFFGSLSPGSFFGFIGNFAMAWLPYRLWWKTGLVRRADLEPLRINSTRKAANFLLLSVGGAALCALTIGWGLELLGLVPFKVLALLIFVNNSAPVLLLSLPILLVLYPRISRWGLLWTDIVGAAGVDESVQKTLPGALFIGTGILLGLAGGLYISLAAGMNPLVMAGAGLLLVFIGAMF